MISANSVNTPFNHSLFSDDALCELSASSRFEEKPRSSKPPTVSRRTVSRQTEQRTLISMQPEATPRAGARVRAEKKRPLSAGDKLTSPAGRQLLVADVFVPRSNADKSRKLPAQFRQLNRKVVVFANGAIAPLQDINARYRLVSA